MALNPRKYNKALFLCLLILGAALFCVGVLNREFIGVMQKGVRVCLECIGIA